MLNGIKVLDPSRVLAGMLCTMILGDMGADVIEVERPDTGDETRGWGPPFEADGQSAYFLSVIRNELGIVADLQNQVDLHLVRGLAREADVVVDNFLPGTLARREHRGRAGERRAEHAGERPATDAVGQRTRLPRPGEHSSLVGAEGWSTFASAPDRSS